VDPVADNLANTPKNGLFREDYAMLTRRRMLGSAAATVAALVAMPTGAARAAAPTVRTAVDFDIPRSACDCHVHIFDPEHFPYAKERVYTPPTASVADLRDLQSALHFERVVIVQPSVYGTDNSCTLDAIRQLGARARGVAVIDASTSAAALDDMAKRACAACGSISRRRANPILPPSSAALPPSPSRCAATAGTFNSTPACR
jgi:hypothetical protein